MVVISAVLVIYNVCKSIYMTGASLCLDDHELDAGNFLIDICPPPSVLAKSITRGDIVNAENP